MNIKYDCNEVGRTRKEEDEVGWWRLRRFIQFKQIFNETNSSTLILSLALHSHSCLIQWILPASARGMLSSLHSISVPLHNLLLFIQSLHANYCNQTQVFLNLHLTYLLTACPPSLSLTADLAGPRPPCHIPPPPDSGEPPRPAAHAPPPFLERKSATAVEPLQGCIMVRIESEFPSLEIIVKGENRPLDC